MKQHWITRLFIFITIIALSACGNSSPTTAKSQSANAHLDNLVLSDGALDQPISRDVTAYSAAVANDVSSITLMPSVEDSGAKIKVNGTALSSGAVSEPIPLNVGDNLISVVITAPDGSTRKTYSVTVTRGASDNVNLSALALSTGAIGSFSPTQLTYNLTIEATVPSVSVTATPEDSGATLTVDGIDTAAGEPSQAIALTQGETKSVFVVVTAQDGSAQQTYTLNLTRQTLAASNNSNVNLSNLVVSVGAFTPGFSSAQLTYDMTVTNTINSLTVTAVLEDLASTLAIDGVITASGDTSAPLALVAGNNSFPIVVTGADSNTTKTYTLNVYREPSSVATLSGLTLSSASLDQSFSSGTLAYTATVGYGVNSIDLTPTLTDTTASVKINNQNAVSGQAKTLSLGVGVNPVTVAVTAENGTTTISYTLNITRSAGDNAKLSTLALSAGTLVPTFDPNTTVYVAEVANSVSSLSLTPTLQANGATMTVNSTPLNSGDTFGPQALSVGSGNTFTIEVTSENSGLVQPYTVTVTRYRNEPIFTSGTSFTVPENSTAVTSVSAGHDAGVTVTYSFGGGVDDGAFTLDANTGALAFASAPNADAPVDGNSDNTYEITVRASATVDSTTYHTDLPMTVQVTGVDEAPVFDPGNTIAIDENLTAVGTVVATDPEGMTVSYSLIGGSDELLFSITATGVLSFNTARNFESPGDSDANNDYVVIVQADDGTKTASQTFTITINDVNEDPLFSTPVSVNVDENLTAVTTVAATDPEGAAITYSITGGVDANLFSINSSSGDLTFNSAPDYESPADADTNHDYEVQITADDGGASVVLSLTVNVDNVNEAPVISSGNSVTMEENLTAVITVSATDPEGGAPLYSISGGVDEALFSIDANSGALTFNSAADYENPLDDGGDNNYVVEVTAGDGVNVVPQTITIDITQVFDMAISGSQTNQLDLSWTPVAGATFYRLFENPDGVSGWTQVGSDLPGTSTTLDISVHQVDWVNAAYLVEAHDGGGLLDTTPNTSIASALANSIGYLKPNQTYHADGLLGSDVDINDDGTVIVAGQPDWDYNYTFCCGAGYDQGLVYIYRKTGGVWTIDKKQVPAGVTLHGGFGTSVAVSGDGNTFIGQTPGRNNGTVEAFRYSGGVWSYEAGFSPTSSGYFGYLLDMSDDGNTFVALSDDPGNDEVYIYFYNGTAWEEQAKFGHGDTYHPDMAISGDGNTVIFGNGDAAYVYTRPSATTGAIWTLQDTLVPANNTAGDQFGRGVALSNDGNTAIVGAYREDSTTTGIQAAPYTSNNSASSSGAVYLFTRSGSTWTEDYYIKPSDTVAGMYFGYEVTINDAGTQIAVLGSGKIYSFSKATGSWVETTNISGRAGGVDELEMSGDGSRLIQGASLEDGCGNGINPVQDTACTNSGAVYVY